MLYADELSKRKYSDSIINHGVVEDSFHHRSLLFNVSMFALRFKLKSTVKFIEIIFFSCLSITKIT